MLLSVTPAQVFGRHAWDGHIRDRQSRLLGIDCKAVWQQSGWQWQRWTTWIAPDNAPQSQPMFRCHRHTNEHSCHTTPCTAWPACVQPSHPGVRQACHPASICTVVVVRSAILVRSIYCRTGCMYLAARLGPTLNRPVAFERRSCVHARPRRPPPRPAHQHTSHHTYIVVFWARVCLELEPEREGLDSCLGCPSSLPACGLPACLRPSGHPPNPN